MCRVADCVIPTHRVPLKIGAVCLLCVSVSKLFDSDFEIPSKNVIAYETATTDTAQAVAQFSVTNNHKKTSKPTILQKSHRDSFRQAHSAARNSQLIHELYGCLLFFWAGTERGYSGKRKLFT